MAASALRTLIVALALASTLTCASTAASSERWKTYLRPFAGMRISVPANWQDVPLSIAGVRRKIARLRAQRRDALANQYATLIADPYTRKALTTYVFSAFAWPAPSRPITTDVSVRVKSVGNVALRPLVSAVANELGQKQGMTLKPVRFVQLPAGEAGFLRGVQRLDPSYGGARTGFSLYLLLHLGRLYSIIFRTDSRLEHDQRPTFAGIVRRFGYL